VITDDEKLLVSWGTDGQITSHDAWTGRREGLIDMGARVQQLLLTPNPRECFLVLDNSDFRDQADAYLVKASLPELAVLAIARLGERPGLATLGSDGRHVELQGAGLRIFSRVDLEELAGSASSPPAPAPVEHGWHALRGVVRADLTVGGSTLITQARTGSLAVWDVDSGLGAPLPGSSYAMS